jgi:CRISPR-associated endonuclease/helicase Cas3
MDRDLEAFDRDFAALSGFDRPFRWQQRLFRDLLAGDIPSAVDLPTGLGKTSVMTIWLLARAHGARLPRRLVYVVDRRAVVDQATEEAEKLRRALDGKAEHFEKLNEDASASAKQRAADLKERLGLTEGRSLAISTLRGAHVDNREWLSEPGLPAIIVGTVDMIGSRLLFSGYGVSRRMRPYHAGLLGVDSWLVLDEAHLVPPFEKLLEAVEDGKALFAPTAEDRRQVLPSFRLLSLSATGRERAGKVFRLQDEDIPDIERRLQARKTAQVVAISDEPLEQALAFHAWTTAKSGAANVRCVIYCNSREIAQKTEKALRKLEDDGRRKGAATPKAAIELFVGARRTFEREKARQWLQTYGFLAGSSAPLQPAFLIATSAGEVGVDLDADHMVCDLAPWERMVQRLGRVNRRGEGDAQVTIVDQGEPKAKKPEAPTPSEKRDLIAYRVLEVMKHLPATGRGIDLSPAAFRDLKLQAEVDGSLKALLRDASSVPPLHPPLSRALVDAWSMTSLEEHAGRPDIEPWLRGWDEENEPQTAVVWRRILPVRRGEPAIDEIEGFFEAAPPHASELLETETRRVVEWLLQRAKSMTGSPTATSPDAAVAFVLTPAREIKRRQKDGPPLLYTISGLLPEDKARARSKVRLERDLAGAILIVDARIGGLAANGLLDGEMDDVPLTADSSDGTWLGEDDKGRPLVGFRVYPNLSPDDIPLNENEGFVFAVDRSEDGQDERVHFVETWATEESRATSMRQQLLDEHHCWTEKAATSIAASVGLKGQYAEMLEIAARLHDEGKRADRWQRAFHAPRGGGVYAKTTGPLSRSYLGGYRHEFGSLPYAEKDAALHALPHELATLGLHLISAHHGLGRPLIDTRGCEDAPPELLQARARKVALRFAELQGQWGPWGLAWWETLLRAADQQASRQNDAEGEAADG